MILKLFEYKIRLNAKPYLYIENNPNDFHRYIYICRPIIVNNDN